MLAQSDTRLFERINGELAVRYSPQGGDGECCSTTRNISGGGIRMPLLKKLRPGTTVDLEIFKYNTDMSLRCMGRVMWIWDAAPDKKEKEEKLFEAGIKFLNPNLLNLGRLIESLGKSSILV